MADLKEGFNELTGPCELVEIRDGVPVSYCSLGDYEPTYEEEQQILARIEAATGFQVALAGPWELVGGDPRYADHSVKLLAFTKRGG